MKRQTKVQPKPPETPHERVYANGQGSLKCQRCGHPKSLHQLELVGFRYSAGKCHFTAGESCECQSFDE